MTAFTFTIRTRERSQLTGQAVICPDARYVSVLWAKSAYPERRFAPPAQWKDVISQLDDTLPAAPLDDKSAIARLLVGERAPWVAVQYLSQEPIGDDVPPSQVIVELDQRLRLAHQVR